VKLKIWVIIIFITVVCGCGEKTDNNIGKVIRINPYDATEYVNLSEIADSIKCFRYNLPTVTSWE
jgi:hypothetical protein